MRKFKKKNSTLLHYLSKCEIINLETIKKLFNLNKMHVNYNQFSKPERCETCFKNIQQQLINSLFQGVLIFECLKQKQIEKKKFFIEKKWLDNYFSHLTYYQSITKESFLYENETKLPMINDNFQNQRKDPYFKDDLVEVSQNFLFILLELYGGNVIYQLRKSASFLHY